jgi:2',3'-cyclic-nucleotide 2'-phosphodiesterase
MPDKPYRILMLGDVIGRSGLRAVVTALSRLKKEQHADFVIVNGENSADGFGINSEIAGELFSAGVDVITTGNHIWQQKEVYPYLDREERILRPANYPGGNPGHGSCVVAAKGTRVGVVNLQGRVRLAPIDCPFRKGKEIARKLANDADFIFIDFHAEATDEKEALAWHLLSDAIAVVGTHTHVQTADERILGGRLAYITDVGACGPSDSVIGFDPTISMDRVRTQLPIRNEVSNNTAVIHGVLVEVDRDEKKALSIRRIQEESLV